MEISVYSRFGSLKKRLKNPVLTMGTFDGVHMGHKKIIRLIENRAKKIGGVPVVFTFKQHPQKVLSRKKGKRIYLLNSFLHKLFLIGEEGVRICITPDFNRWIFRLSPERFVEETLVRQIGVKEIYLGRNAHFGYKRKGNIKSMAKLSRKYGFKFHAVETALSRNKRISSSLIRESILAGRLKEASRMLGRDHSILATIIKGRGKGKKLGFPTANLDPHSEALPPMGVYIVTINLLEFKKRHDTRHGCTVFRRKIVKKDLRGLLNLGVRPTFGEEGLAGCVPEVYILNFRGNIYNRLLEVVFHKKIRNEKKFKDLESLKKRINKDTKEADKYFKKSKYRL